MTDYGGWITGIASKNSDLIRIRNMNLSNYITLLENSRLNLKRYRLTVVSPSFQRVR